MRMGKSKFVINVEGSGGLRKEAITEPFRGALKKLSNTKTANGKPYELRKMEKSRSSDCNCVSFLI